MIHEMRPGAIVPETVVAGMTQSGRKCRPSDCIERLHGMRPIFGAGRRLSCSPYRKPVVADGPPRVVVHRKRKSYDPAAFRFLAGFAQDNELRMRPGRDPNAVGAATKRNERRVPQPEPERSS
jgi:hypothetical protein